jgi:hypothetical protein
MAGGFCDPWHIRLAFTCRIPGVLKDLTLLSRPYTLRRVRTFGTPCCIQRCGTGIYFTPLKGLLLKRQRDRAFTIGFLQQTVWQTTFHDLVPYVQTPQNCSHPTKYTSWDLNLQFFISIFLSVSLMQKWLCNTLFKSMRHRHGNKSFFKRVY